MAYPLTGSTLTATNGVAKNTLTTAKSFSPFSRIWLAAIALPPNGTSRTTGTPVRVNGLIVPATPSSGQMWPRGGRTSTG